MKINKVLNILLISVLSISAWEIGKKQVGYVESRITYQNIKKEKEQYDNMQEYLDNKQYDWITLSETAINYPLVKSADNQYYLTHNYLGEESISGSIYYDATDEPYNGSTTIIYGHSMKDGSMFNNLHYFQKDKERFKNSTLTIDTKEGTKVYIPIGYAVYTSDNNFYRQIDNMNSKEGMQILEQECDYFIKDNINIENVHVIALVTCDYSIDNGRLVCFYIESSSK